MEKNFSHRFSHPAFLSFLSGLLLLLSFPGTNFGFLAWFALIPFLAALEKARSRGEALGYGAITGAVFYGLSLHWLTWVALVGWLFVTCLETSFLLLFAWAAYELRNTRPLVKPFLLGLGWMTMEILRAEVPDFAFGWNLLAYSQAHYLPVAQAANTFGAYGLGFVMFFVQAAVWEIAKKGSSKTEKNILTLLILTAVILTAAHGRHFLRQPLKKNGPRISLIQGNIPQDLKWEYTVREQIMQIYSKLTELASFDQPDLIIWPEASYPGYFNQDTDAEKLRQLFKKLNVPAVIGAPHLAEQNRAYNSAYLVDAEGNIKSRYDKQHLVPFGEYVPLKIVFGWLEPLAYSLGVSDFTAGQGSVIFKTPNDELAFSILICFEDIFPALARRSVDQGAEFLGVITNDAWFGPTSAAEQHLQASVFRAIENGVPVVRAANTGVSAFIDSRGRVLERLADKAGNTIFVTGYKTRMIPYGSRDTLYRKGGWVFPYAGAGLFVIMFLLILFRKKNEK